MIELGPTEKVVKQVRKHWLPFCAEVLFLLFLAIVPIVAFVFLPERMAQILPISGDINVLFIFFYILWLVVLWMALFYIWTDYYLDVWIITSERIIDIEQKGFFNREISSLRLDRIQDVTISVPGFIPTIFGYGNILVQTAGADVNFKINKASDPERIKKIILESYAAARQGPL